MSRVPCAQLLKRDAIEEPEDWAEPWETTMYLLACGGGLSGRQRLSIQSRVREAWKGVA